MLKENISPEQIKKKSVRELNELAGEIREELIKCVSDNGGHLASNLGIVELTLALHYVFDSPKDKFVFDVGHQSYVHKMITGRMDRFNTIRKKSGLAGFPDPTESDSDCFVAGHASNAISAALGMIRGGEKNHVVTILGDGALTGGMCYEALNDAGQSKIPMIVILNDNEMSISRNVGAMSFYLDHMRQNVRYTQMKSGTKSLLARIPLIGPRLYHLMEKLHHSVKALFIDDSFFEALGFNYIGPIDGHDIKKLIGVLSRVKNNNRPILLHVVTQKGKGYKPAENAPDSYHGVAPFFIDSGLSKNQGEALSYGREAARMLTAFADSDPNICVVCAAMVSGTGMEMFKEHHPDRFYDVGIAEEHAVTMAAGMAYEGKHPYVAIYSTFLQRCYDQIMIDVCRNSLPVTFLIDRAGLTGADGKTHQGTFDIGFLRTIPHLVIMSPRDVRAYRRMIRFSTEMRKPLAIRYSKETIDLGTGFDSKKRIEVGSWEELIPGKDAMIFAEGATVNTALTVSIKLASEGISCGVTDAMFLKPIDEALIKQCASQNRLIITLEENTVAGGLGSAVASVIAQSRHGSELLIIGTPDDFVEHASISQQRDICGLDAESIIEKIRKYF